MGELIRNPHDALFKETLTKKENALNFLENYLPAEVLAIVDLANLEIEKDSFIDDELQEYFSDLLYKVRFEGEDGYIYILFEHKSYNEKWISLQILEYMLRCWKLKRSQQQTLPVIIPLVLYHGEKAWTVGVKLSDMFQVRKEILQKYIPDFEYVLYDLHSYSDEKIVGTTYLKIVLLLFKYVRNPRLHQKLAEILKLLPEDDMNFLYTVIVYLLNATKLSKKELVCLVTENLSRKGGEFVISTAEKLYNEGRAEGLVEGRAEGLVEGRVEGHAKGRVEGRAEGRVEGLTEGIELALEIKFGTESATIVEKIRGIKNLEKLVKIRKLLQCSQTFDEFQRQLQQL